VAAALVLFEVTRQRKWGMGLASKDPPLSSYGVGLSPEKDFFRSSPDPAPQTAGEGAPQRFDIGPSDNLEENFPPESPGNPKGGGFKW
ncbi:MAG TPA: hypothetical protein VK859_15865, partial [bacterium]|nr:hypothetical protein [bacterium]